MSTRVEQIFRAVLDLSPEDRARFFTEESVDATTQKEVEALLTRDSHFSRSLDDHIGSVARQVLGEVGGMQCGPYRLGELLGSGGMGSVYAADRVDGEVTQRVAIKLLRPGANSPQWRQRFLAERQILATLSHPNIGRLLDAGHREDGQPYLVMEYIEGKPIDVFTDAFSLRRKVAVFLKVCSAVSYLHRNLVVHRDLKPGNILVTPEGEPKLLDFGIAKMLDWAGDSTVTVAAMLTPDYASPEQVAHGPITTSTDIYSLGAVLYKLLTGKSPHQFEDDSAEAIVSAVSSGRITAPSKLEPHVNGDLEIILMKALRTEPQERYASVEQFSADLENYLEFRPISARKGDVWYRARKFLRLYWVPVATAALTIAGLSTGLAIANHQRALAQRRFVQVRQLANKLFDIETEVRRTPGTTKARELIVNTSVEYLRRLAEDVGRDTDLAFELGNAYMRVARVQGVPVSFNLGHIDDADESLRMAENLMASVLSARPGDRVAMLRSAQIALDRMSLASVRRRNDETLAFARKSAEWLAKYESTGKIDPAEATVVANTYTNLGNRYAFLDQIDEAIRLSRHAKDIALAAGQQSPAGAAMWALANALHRKGDVEEALQTIRESVRLLETQTPKSISDMNVAGALVTEGMILTSHNGIGLNRPEEAVAPLERAIAICDEFAQRDVNDSGSRDRLFSASTVLAQIVVKKDPGRALEIYDHTLDRLAELPKNASARRKEVWILANSTYALRKLGRNEESRRRLDLSLAHLKELNLYPADGIPPEVNEVLRALADHEEATGNIPRAIEVYDDLGRRIAAGTPETGLEAAVALSGVYTELIGLHRRIGQNDLASDLETRRLELWRRWSARLPNNGLVSRHLADASKVSAPNN